MEPAASRAQEWLDNRCKTSTMEERHCSRSPWPAAVRGSAEKPMNSKRVDGSTTMRPAGVQVLARRGLTVLAALDAPTPTAYSLLDRVLVLLQGRTMYFGSTGEHNLCRR